MIDSQSESQTASVDLHQHGRRKSPVKSVSVDRSPPHSIPAEQGVLGCILLAPSECLGICLERIKDPLSGASSLREKGPHGRVEEPVTSFFYDLRHQHLFETLVTLYNKSEAIDLITLQQRLRDQKLLDSVGGVAYLSELADTVPSAANLSHYLDIVWDKYLLRKMVHTCTSLVSQAYEFEGEVPVLLDEVERRIYSINQERGTTGTAVMKKLVSETMHNIEGYWARQGTCGGLTTGFTELDQMTDGLHKGEMIIIAARPSMGKTSLAMNIVEHVALGQKMPVAVFSLEMTATALVERMLFSQSRLNQRQVRKGMLADRDFDRLSSAASKLSPAPLFIDDAAGLSILQLRARARRLHQSNQLKLIVVDYLQLLHSTSRRASENRQQEIAEISSGIKALAKELEIPIIVLSQLNREMERDKNRKPRLSDLRESGSIEQDADLVGLLYKPASEDEEEGERDETSDGVPVNLLIAKQRNGPTGDVPLVFLRNYTRFESVARVHDDDVPVPA